ncbi:MAG: right-handed parallel beta-helix repeat-containing protein [Dokdonella sp.]|uniref:right-handed parallel beta-helix repeat-containing protein n=1 Tax=Dokdonella sp. TaxID=2291710 RepID=UPI003267E1F9
MTKPVGFILLMLFLAAPAAADTFTVTTTTDAGTGSLRQAMLDANAKQVTNGSVCAGHTIAFDIAGVGPHTIQPLSPLPMIHIPMAIDGYSQPGAIQNNQPIGSNAVIAIEIDGSLAGNTDAFVVAAAFTNSGLCPGNTSSFSGLVINRFAGAAISMGEELCPPGNFCLCGGVRIWGNYIGTDVTGTQARGNGAVLARAALVFGTSSGFNTVGEQTLTDGGSSDPRPEARNVISGNGADGILIYSTSTVVGNGSAQTHTIRNNYIGLDASGTAALANGGRGIELGPNSMGMQIFDNLISANVGDGIAILDAPLPFTSVIGNGIGIGATGEPLGNGGHGVYVGNAATGVTVGSRWLFAPINAAISNNADAGVFVDGSAIVDAGNLSSAHNGSLAFDIAPAGPNANDAGDADPGPNEGLNSPVIDFATADSGGQTGSVGGFLDAVPNSTYEIHFFYSDACDAGGFGGGQVPYPLSPSPSNITVTTDASGHAAFARPAQFLPAGKVLTAVTRAMSTIASPTAFMSSEYSNCAVIVGADRIFADGFE